MSNWTITAEPGEGEEVYKFNDPKTGRELTLPMVINGVATKQLFEGTIEKSKMTAKKQYQAQIEELTAKVSDYEETKSRLADLETGSLSASDKSKKEVERYQAEALKQKTEAERLRLNLHKQMVGTAVIRELGEIKGLVNVNKAETLFSQECSPKLVEVNGEFKVVATYEGSEMSLSEAREKWIARDDNKFLLQNTLSPGSGSTGGQGKASAKTMKRDNFSAMKPSEQAAFINQGGDLID